MSITVLISSHHSRDYRVQERTGSFFEGTHLPWSKQVALLHLWSLDIPVKTAAAILGLTKKVIVAWHKESSDA